MPGLAVPACCVTGVSSVLHRVHLYISRRWLAAEWRAIAKYQRNAASTKWLDQQGGLIGVVFLCRLMASARPCRCVLLMLIEMLC